MKIKCIALDLDGTVLDGRGELSQGNKEALEEAAAREFAALLYEDERTASFRSRIPPGLGSAALLTGPEGGFTSGEVAAARQAGIAVCTLGPRILRCETAPLCALSALMFACGELD